MGHGSTSVRSSCSTASRRSTSDVAARRPRLVVSLPFVASVVALLLNDHVLKQAWPGWVTGKLSDVAGVAMVAIALTALLRVRAFAFAVTTMAFVVLKTVPAVAESAAAVIGGRTLTDPTDLLALAVLVPLWRWMSTRPRPAASAPPSSDARRQPIWIVPVQIAAIVFAVVATTGSDCAPDGLFDVRAIDGILYARADLDVWTSDDGGASWQSSDIDGLDARFQQRDDPPVCVGERCFGIEPQHADGSYSVVETSGGTATTVLEMSATDRREFVRALTPTCGGFSSGDVAASQVGDDLHLVVEMGEGGVLHRGPDGPWEWVAVGVWGLGEGDVPADSFLGHEIASRPDRGLFASDWLARTLLLGAPISALAAAAPLGVLAARRGRSTVAAVLLVALLALVLMAPAALFLMFLAGASPGSVGGYVVAGGVLCLIAAVGIGLLTLWFGRSARPIADEPAWPTPTPQFPTPVDE